MFNWRKARQPGREGSRVLIVAAVQVAGELKHQTNSEATIAQFSTKPDDAFDTRELHSSYGRLLIMGTNGHADIVRSQVGGLHVILFPTGENSSRHEMSDTIVRNGQPYLPSRRNPNRQAPPDLSLIGYVTGFIHLQGVGTTPADVKPRVHEVFHPLIDAVSVI